MSTDTDRIDLIARLCGGWNVRVETGGGYVLIQSVGVIHRPHMDLRAALELPEIIDATETDEAIESASQRQIASLREELARRVDYADKVREQDLELRRLREELAAAKGRVEAAEARAVAAEEALERVANRLTCATDPWRFEKWTGGGWSWPTPEDIRSYLGIDAAIGATDGEREGTE